MDYIAITGNHSSFSKSPLTARARSLRDYQSQPAELVLPSYCSLAGGSIDRNTVL